MTRNIECFIKWAHPTIGRLEIVNGTLESLQVMEGGAQIEELQIAPEGQAPLQVQVKLSCNEVSSGQETTIVRWKSEENAFSFLPVHLFSGRPITIPDFGVAIALELADSQPPHSSSTTEDLPTGTQISWDTWAAINNQPQTVPTVLGLSRDQRFFVIEPDKERFSASLDLKQTQIIYILNRTSCAADRCERSLEEGYLPILHSRQTVGPFLIEDTWFVTLGDRPLSEQNVLGTPLSIAHLGSVGHTFPPGVKETVAQKAASWSLEGEVVAYLRTRITNTSALPRLAVQKLPTACMLTNGKEPVRFDGPWHLQEDGVVLADQAPLSMHLVNGAPPSSMQPAVLLDPGDTLTLESLFSHRLGGLSPEVRAQGIRWEEKLEETKAFWEGKIQQATQVNLPEPRLGDLWRAGLCHLELVTLGRQHESLLAKAGMYSAIGSESLPIIEFFDSVGQHDTAERAIDAFFDLQWPNGRLNLFLHYDIETGAVLFLAGRHFAYTKNTAWVRRQKEGFKRAAGYLLSQRQLHDREAAGYGLITGACADPKEKFSSFMLNAYAITGLVAVVEMLGSIQDESAESYRQQAEEFLSVFRAALKKSFALGPVLPVSEARWVPTCAPWAEGVGLQMMGLQGEVCYSHRSYVVYDAMLGPLYAVFAGLIDPREREAGWLLEINSAHMNRSAITESQPYYGRHPEIHLLRGEKEAFLNAFYSGLVSMADRETFSFWEHLYQVSIHKTHEEGWALMQLRRMLWVELEDTLHLLWGIPENWLGQLIRLEQASSYFGPFSFSLEPVGSDWAFHWRPSFHTAAKQVIVHLDGKFAPLSEEEAKLDASGNLQLLRPSTRTEISLKFVPQEALTQQGISLSSP